MPLHATDVPHDKSDDWLEVFHQQRREALAGIVTAELLDEESSMREPETVQHHARLRLLMNYIRLSPAVGKSFVYAEVPYQRYRVGYVTERGAPAELLDEPIFESEREARDHVLRMRIEAAGLAVGE